MPAIEKFRRSMYLLGRLVIPYGTTAPTLADDGQMAIAHVGGTARLVFRSGGSTFLLAMPTAAAGGSITITSAA